MKQTLFKHQKKFLDANPDKCALVWSCGTGKTLTAINWSNRSPLSVLVICPKALKANWTEQVDLHASHGATILTKEEFKKFAPTLPAYGQIIVDEVHIGFLTPLWKSQMSKSLKKYVTIHKVSRILALSATPYTSSPWNVYNLAWLLGHRWNWREFRLRFFYDVRMGPRIVPVPKPGCEKKLAPLVAKIADVVDINDVMDVPLQHHEEPETFSLTKEQERGIDAAYDPLPIVRYTWQHEIEQGILYDQVSKKVHEFPSDKTARIMSLIEENPKIAVVCRYNAQIDYLYSILRGGFNTYMIRGDVKNRHEICADAEAASQAVVLIQADCAEGYELPSFPVCVFASQSYSYVKWEQMCGRFLRMNKPSRTTFLYLLTAGDSIDRAVYDAVKRKEDFKIELFKKKR